jgi:hypothetical protein
MFRGITTVPSLRLLSDGVRQRQQASSRPELGGERRAQVMGSISKVNENLVSDDRGRYIDSESDSEWESTIDRQ